MIQAFNTSLNGAKIIVDKLENEMSTCLTSIDRIDRQRRRHEQRRSLTAISKWQIETCFDSLHHAIEKANSICAVQYYKM